MAKYELNPNNKTTADGTIVPFCPAAAEVLYTPLQQPGTYQLARYDWGSYDRKAGLSLRLYNTVRYIHVGSTTHDLVTGRLMPADATPKFGTTDTSVADRAWRDRQASKARAKRWLAEILDNPNEHYEWADAFHNLYNLVTSADNLIAHIEEKTGQGAKKCENCSDPAFSRQEVRTGLRRGAYQNWCSCCVDENSTYCDGEYVDNDSMVHVRDIDEHVPVWVAENRYYQDDDGDWYSEPQDNDDDASGTGSPELHGYHTTKSLLRGWTMAPDGAPTVTTGCWAPMTIGIELEVEADGSYGRGDTVENVVAGLRRIIGNQSLYAEEDGSLDDEKGFELIFGWTDLQSWQRAMPRIGTVLQNGDIISHDADGNYGLHVNVAVTNDYIVQCAITHFINNTANDRLLYALARRESGYYCERVSGAWRPADEHRSAVNFGDTPGVFSSNPAGKVIDCKSTIASFRLFRGTTSPVRLMADIEFCHSLVAAATEYSYRWASVMQDVHRGMFTEFTSRYWQNYVLKNITRYPTLVHYLRAWDERKHSQDSYRHHAFSDYVLTRFVSQYPMGLLTGAHADGLDKRALSALKTPKNFSTSER